VVVTVEERRAALLLDLDGTLIDSQAAQERAWGTWAERKGYDVKPFVTTHGMTAWDKIRTYAPGLNPYREVAWIAAHEVEDTGDVVALPGALEALTGPWPVAIVTSATHPLALARLEAVGLPVPSVMVTADDTRQGKPDPAPYLQAAERLGYSPAMCDVLEDAPLGVVAGKAAGMLVFGVLGTVSAKALGGAHYVVRDVAQYLREYRR
jgi:sugar-phosphatase